MRIIIIRPRYAHHVRLAGNSRGLLGQRAKIVRAELCTDVDVMALLRGIVSSRLSISGHSSQESKLNSSLRHMFSWYRTYHVIDNIPVDTVRCLYNLSIHIIMHILLSANSRKL